MEKNLLNKHEFTKLWKFLHEIFNILDPDKGINLKFRLFYYVILDGSVTVPDIVRFIETSHFQTLSKTGHEALDKELANIKLNTKKQYDVIDVFSILPKIHNLK